MKRTSLLFSITLVFLFLGAFYFESSKAQKNIGKTSTRNAGQEVPTPPDQKDNSAKIITRREPETVELFELMGPQRPQSIASVAGIQEQEVRIHFGESLLETAERLRFTLLDGKTYEAVRNQVEGFVRFASNEYSWHGKVLGENNWSGDIVLTVKDQAMSGLIYSPAAVYEIVPQQDFKHLLVQIDQSKFPPCGGAVLKKAVSNNDDAISDVQVGFDDGSQIDVMIVYTAAVRLALGGTTQAQTFAQQAVSTTNSVYQNSGIATRLRLVQTMEVGYADNGDGEAGLEWLAGDATVAAARNAAKADLVSMLTENANDVCGIGYLMTNVAPSFASLGFSLAQRACAIGGLTFPHELGHNQGCDHNPENGYPASDLAYPYAYGHWNASASFRTVMSYSNPCPSCPRIPYFSNPAVTYSGIPIGIANQRDNTRVINNTAFTVSRFRDSGVQSGPNLTPHQPSGWSDKIVVSNTTGSTTNSSPLRTTDTLYVDWAVLNNGSGATSATFYTKLFVDGVERTSWSTDPPLNVNFYAYIQD
ncbi:MAG TPA: M12 family metallo-peptidase, partial [Pyrinomonadaceae bacterium]|nr:M12 family metallo-peptidase [Pyrinomonadaceae bacterium]